MQYRKELDGIRALAVVAVIFYHAELMIEGIRVLPGGYFGVDVFFVLSGYLITGMLTATQSFSVQRFFVSRFNRIYPMLLVMLMVASCYAYFFLMPAELEVYSNELVSAIGSYSNFHFMSEDSYVSDVNKLKPLIHTWSLGVEWQFYLVFPFFILLLSKLLPRYRVEGVLLAAALSLLYCINLSDGNLQRSFYLPFSRCWELLAGALVCLLGSRKPVSNTIGYVLPLVGLSLMIVPMFIFDDQQVHPGYITLLPVAGCCLFVMYGRQNAHLTKLLSLPPFAFLGLISYSLYLWHQPFFAFYRLRFEEFTWAAFGILMLILLPLSFLTFRFVESPFRRSGDRKKYFVLVSFMITGIGFFTLVQTTQGLPKRLEGVALQVYSDYRVPEFRKLTTDVPGVSVLGENTFVCIHRVPSSACKFGDESWVTVGDSFAGMYESELKRKLEELGHGLVTMSYEQCPFFDEDIWVGDAPECILINKQRWEAIRSMSGRRTFVVSGSFTQFYKAKKGIDDPLASVRQGYTKVDSEKVYASFARSVEELLRLGHKVVLIYPTPSIMTNVKNKLYRDALYAGGLLNRYDEKVNMSLISRVEADIDRHIKAAGSIIKVKPTEVFCNDAVCTVIDGEGGLFNVTSHLSNLGARRVIARFL